MPDESQVIKNSWNIHAQSSAPSEREWHHTTSERNIEACNICLTRMSEIRTIKKTKNVSHQTSDIKGLSDLDSTSLCHWSKVSTQKISLLPKQSHIYCKITQLDLCQSGLNPWSVYAIICYTPSSHGYMSIYSNISQHIENNINIPTVATGSEMRQEKSCFCNSRVWMHRDQGHNMRRRLSQ